MADDARANIYQNGAKMIYASSLRFGFGNGLDHDGKSEIGDDLSNGFYVHTVRTNTIRATGSPLNSSLYIFYTICAVVVNGIMHHASVEDEWRSRP